MLTKETYPEIMSVKNSVEGRSPVHVSEEYVACVDRNGLSARVYRNQGEYPLMHIFEV